MSALTTSLVREVDESSGMSRGGRLVRPAPTKQWVLQGLFEEHAPRRLRDVNWHESNVLAERLRTVTGERDQAREQLGHAAQVIEALRHLVGKAFEEGFRARLPERDEPWLVDWLQSAAKTELGHVVAPKVLAPEDAE